MRSLLEKCSVVLLGAWNSAIFTPDWLAEHLGIERSDQRIEFPVGNPRLPIRYTFEGMAMVVGENQLVLGPTRDGDDVLARMEEHARALLLTLRHTPMGAIGINFEFIESDPPTILVDLLRASDKSRLAGHDFVVQATELKRALLHGVHGLVHFTLKRQQDMPEVGIHLNFHKPVENSAAAAEHLDRRVLSCRDFAVSALRQLYELELEED
jgi:hypothetical protein